MNPNDLHWSAGFLEGEGYFGPGFKNYLTVECSQTQKEPLMRLQTLWGGTINLRKVNTRPIWKWRARGRAAKQIMYDLYPLMTLKRQIAINRAMQRNFFRRIT